MKRSEGLKPPMPPHSSAKFVGRAQARDSMKVVTRQSSVVGKSVFCFALCALLFALCSSRSALRALLFALCSSRSAFPSRRSSWRKSLESDT
jgi:hypothetical protein